MEIRLDLPQSCNQVARRSSFKTSRLHFAPACTPANAEIWSGLLAEFKKKKKKLPRYVLSPRLDREAFLNYSAQNIDSSEAAR